MLADLLVPGSNDVRLHLLDEGLELTLGDLWRRADAVAGWLATLEGRPAAMVLTNSAACVTVLVGALVHGAHVVSLSPPWPGADATTYGRFVADCCHRSGADHLVVDARYLPALPPLSTVTAVSYEEVGGGVGARPLARSPFVLTQFTSGSTTEPKGVVLDEAAVEANVRAILEWLGPEPGDGACSWLPLSHDMGLIGMFLTTLVGGGPGWADGTDLVLLTPEAFRRDPRCWLGACAAYRSAVTAVPNVALEMAMRRPPGELDLGALRTCIVGAEPVRTDTLRRFEGAYRRHGFGPLAFSPAYGLAECTLAVAGVGPAERWTSSPPPPASPTGGGADAPWAGEEVVSCGRPLPGLEVRVGGARHPGA
ncbi:MAG: AMP-binding protein, partial [Acidimicrobiales bacterium]